MQTQGVLGLALLLLSGAAGDAPPHPTSPELSATQAQEAWHGRLAGRSFKSRSVVETEALGAPGERLERLVVYTWRRDSPDEGERILMQADVPGLDGGVSYLALARPGGRYDVFFVPFRAHKVRRLAGPVARMDVGTVDFEYLGFGAVQREAVEIEDFATDRVGGRPALRLVELAIADGARFDRRTTWLDPETFVPLRSESELGGKLVLTATTLAIERKHGTPTPTSVRFERPGLGKSTLLRVEFVDYDVEIPDRVFTTGTLAKHKYPARERREFPPP